MSDFLERVKFVSVQVNRNIQRIKQQLQMQGQQVGDKELLSHFLPSFEEGLAELEGVVLDVLHFICCNHLYLLGKGYNST